MLVPPAGLSFPTGAGSAGQRPAFFLFRMGRRSPVVAVGVSPFVPLQSLTVTLAGMAGSPSMVHPVDAVSSMTGAPPRPVGV